MIPSANNNYTIADIYSVRCIQQTYVISDALCGGTTLLKAPPTHVASVDWLAQKWPLTIGATGATDHDPWMNSLNGGLCCFDRL